MGFEDLKIRDVSRISGEWAPPVSALGGPPAHELYRELVLYAGMQLCRDAHARPWIVFRDGSQRRAFPVPSPELRGALDRFRMRRNVRPVPEGDIEEFARIVQARVSDPDVEIPALPVLGVDRASVLAGPPVGPTEAASLPSGADATDGLPRVPDPANEVESPKYLPFVPDGARSDPAPEAPNVRSAAPDLARSGAIALNPHDGANLARYVRIFRSLVRDGDWMGTTGELAQITREEPFTMYATLLRLRSELAENDILVANVEVDEGYQWLAVDRARLRRPDERASPEAVTVVVR